MKLLSREVEISEDSPNGLSGARVIRVVNTGDEPVVLEVFVPGEDDIRGSVTIIPNVPEEIDKSANEILGTSGGTLFATAIRG